MGRSKNRPRSKGKGGKGNQFLVLSAEQEPMSAPDDGGGAFPPSSGALQLHRPAAPAVAAASPAGAAGAAPVAIALHVPDVYSLHDGEHEVRVVLVESKGEEPEPSDATVQMSVENMVSGDKFAAELTAAHLRAGEEGVLTGQAPAALSQPLAFVQMMQDALAADEGGGVGGQPGVQIVSRSEESGSVLFNAPREFIFDVSITSGAGYAALEFGARVVLPLVEEASPERKRQIELESMRAEAMEERLAMQGAFQAELQEVKQACQYQLEALKLQLNGRVFVGPCGHSVHVECRHLVMRESANAAASLEADGAELLMPLSSAELRPLSLLRNLEHLTLAGPGITELEFVSGLLNLKTLVLDSVVVRDLAPMAGLRSLQHFSLLRCNLPGNHVLDLSPLEGLHNLQTMSFAGSGAVQDVQPLQGLKQLVSINLACCEKCVDYSGLGEEVDIIVDEADD